MSEWERLLSGKVYNDFSDELSQLRAQATKLFRAYNQTTEKDVEERRQIMGELFGFVGKDVTIEPDFRCEFGKNIVLGDNVYINFGCVILDCAEVSIGENTLLGPSIGLYAANHSLDPEERIHGGCIGKPIHIGKNAWLGGGVRVVPGVSIGDGTVIGAGSVVTRDIPDHVIAAGNPCKVIRPITDADKTDYFAYLGAGA